MAIGNNVGCLEGETGTPEGMNENYLYCIYRAINGCEYSCLKTEPEEMEDHIENYHGE